MTPPWGSRHVAARESAVVPAHSKRSGRSERDSRFVVAGPDGAGAVSFVAGLDEASYVNTMNALARISENRSHSTSPDGVVGSSNAIESSAVWSRDDLVPVGFRAD